MEIKQNLKTGQIYVNNKCLHKDENGYYTISSTGSGKYKLQNREDIKDFDIVQKIENFITT